MTPTSPDQPLVNDNDLYSNDPKTVRQQVPDTAC